MALDSHSEVYVGQLVNFEQTIAGTGKPRKHPIDVSQVPCCQPSI